MFHTGLQVKRRGFQSVSLKVAKYRELLSTVKNGHFPLWHPAVRKFPKVVTDMQGFLKKISNFNQTMNDRTLTLKRQ